jgi:hypothetical protein
VGDSRKRKRERNTEAARRYRQRRQDRLEELEEALAAMTKDRDELRIKLARSEAETDILKGLMAKKWLVSRRDLGVLSAPVLLDISLSLLVKSMILTPNTLSIYHGFESHGCTRRAKSESNMTGVTMIFILSA